MANDFFEKTLEQIIIQNQAVIHKKGFPKLLDNTHSQFQLPSGGKIDILSFAIDETYDSVSYKIFELKRETIQVDALCQVSEYASELYTFSSPHFKHVNIERYVVGTDYSKQVISLMESQISIDMYLYKYTIDGILFKKVDSFMETQNEEVNKLLYSTSQESVDLYNKVWTLNNTLKKEAKNPNP